MTNRKAAAQLTALKRTESAMMKLIRKKKTEGLTKGEAKRLTELTNRLYGL